MSDLLYKLNKTPEDIETLLQEHKKLVYYMLTTSGQLYNQDAESVAWEALWDALNLFDVFSTTAFSTFACTLIKNAINDVLRKQIVESRHVCSFTYMAESTEIVYICEPEDNTVAKAIEEQFRIYVDSKTGIVRNVLLAWYSSGFVGSVTNIAAMCKTSPSYVSRVQSAFRAYLSGKLKK